VDSGPLGNIVEHYGDVALLGYGLEVLEHAAIIGLIIVWGDQQGSMCARLCGMTGQLHRLAGVLGASSCYHRNRGVLHCDLYHSLMLFEGQSCRLTGSAAGNHA